MIALWPCHPRSDRVLLKGLVSQGDVMSPKYVRDDALVTNGKFLANSVRSPTMMKRLLTSERSQTVQTTTVTGVTARRKLMSMIWKALLQSTLSPGV